MAIKLKRGLEATIPTLKEGEPGFTTDSKKLFVGSDAGNIEIGAPALVEVTWQELKDKRDAGLLTPGQQYRITDYECTTTQVDTRSAGHQFDIIVVADSVNKLNENARATQHEGDTYFANSKLEAWQLMYCLDNDTSRFAWADEVNGKGVIYRMIDEFNNDVPYDFKNIQFKRMLLDGQYDEDSGAETWVYTFSCYDTDSKGVLDATMVSGYLLNNSGNETTFTSENKIEVYTLSGDGDYDTEVLGLAWLNEIVFIERFDVSQLGQEGIYREPTHSNSFGSNCFNMTFGTACAENSFGSGSTDNVFRDYCSNNTFGNSCGKNTFGNSCDSNTFGNSCTSNTFGNYCRSNTFGNTCRDNTFGDNCGNNTFGNNCQHNTFGSSCPFNAFGSDCKYLKISDNTGTQKRYTSVDNGTVGASSVNKFDLYDPAILNKNYQVTFKKSASGKHLMLWTTDTGTMTGKVKDTVLDNTWEDIA
jgi:hypothetical protein